jgi:cyclic pyranopterin phosphate synthase
MKPRRKLSHVDERGRARMVDVSGKVVTRRRATAEGLIRMADTTLDAIRSNSVQKGDVLTVARLSAIGGAKRTAELIPLCHPLALEAVDVEIETMREIPGVRLRVSVTAEARTGVEMEALCAVSAGLLTIYDMCKATDRAMEIASIRLLSKTGGASGEWEHPVATELLEDRRSGRSEDR